MIQCVDPPGAALALHGTAASRRIEAAAARSLPAHTLMQRAGLAVARLALAIAPHARRIWIAAGPGNNGGDGLEAAACLRTAGCDVRVHALGDAGRLPPDAAAARARAQMAGVPIDAILPPWAPDLVIDALLGLGATRAPGEALLPLIETINRCAGPRLAVDLPTGLHADTGQRLGPIAVEATHTLALLTLKPGLLTAAGRALGGRLWFDSLGADAARDAEGPDAWCTGADAARLRAPRAHDAHKGRYGDVLAVGGAPGMGGALTLAARSALAAGAGRVYACALDPSAPAYDLQTPELMWRPGLWRDASTWPRATVVAGCGGGDAIAEALPILLARSARLVLDADALNALASDPGLQPLLVGRAQRGRDTVLTPHPLEAARLLGLTDAAAVQADRMRAAQTLAARFGCVVVLKGSGSVIAAPGRSPALNPTGNARLASAGTGDVLAGWLAGLWAATQGEAPGSPGAFEVAQAAVYLHGAAAEGGDPCAPLTASRLLDRLTAN